MEHIDKFLKELSLFKSFSPSELKMLVEKSHVKTFAPQEVIIQFGQPGRFLGVILGANLYGLLYKSFFLYVTFHGRPWPLPADTYTLRNSEDMLF